MGCGWLQGEKKGIGGARQRRGIGVKEMLTDTINVICLLSQEVDGSLYFPFVPSTFPALALHGLRVWKKPGKERRWRAVIPKWLWDRGPLCRDFTETKQPKAHDWINGMLILPNFMP